MNEVSQGASLIAIEPEYLVAAFSTSGRIEEILSRIENEVTAEAPDVSTVKGRKAIASLAYKVSQSKSALDIAGKSLNDDLRAKINVVDAERRKIRGRLDALRDRVRKPLDEWEDAEDARVDALKQRVERLRQAHTTLPDDAASDQIAALLARVEDVAMDGTWAEFIADAARYKDQACATLRDMLSRTRTREAEQAELARLRAEAEARAKAEADRLAAEEAERQRIAAEKAEAERQARIERERQEAVERATRDAEARARAEAERAALEAAEREAALGRAKAEAEARHQRELAEAKAREDRAAQAERDRIAAQAKAEADARAKREADTAHRARIAGDIADALRTMSGRAAPEAIAAALMDGKIPHCFVRL